MPSSEPVEVRRGRCEGCERNSSKLRRIDSSQWICAKCWKVFHPPVDRMLRYFYTKIVGVTRKNRDRTNRQKIIASCRVFEKLTLRHEEDNRHDKNAVAVLRETGEQIGYLDRDLASEIVSLSNDDVRFAAYITSLTGGADDRPTLGVNVMVLLAGKDVSDAEVQTYLDSLDLTDRYA